MIAAWTDDASVVEIMVNPDGKLWLDRLAGGLEDTGAYLSPEDGERIARLVAHHAGAARVSAELPEPGERFEGLSPPVVLNKDGSFQRNARFRGPDLDSPACDEEPPLDHYLEALARLGATEGLAYSTFTPLQGYNVILPRFRERTPEAMRSRGVVRMRIEDAGHFADEEKRARQVASYSEHQRKTRADGVPMQGSGAVFEDVDLNDLVEPLRVQGNEIIHSMLGPLDVKVWTLLWGIDFGINHPFAAVLLGWDRDRDCIYILAEVKIKGCVPAIHASRMKAIAANVPVAWPHDGTQRDKGSGEQLASIYKREGLRMLPSHATHPTGGYGTEAGIMEMLTRMRSDRLKVAAGCIEWRDEFMGYHRKDGLIVKTNDDLLSATRVGVMQIRSSKPVPLGAARREMRGSAQIADGVDFDVFDV